MNERQSLESIVKCHVCVHTLFLETVQISTDAHTEKCGLRHIHINIRAKVELLVVRGIVDRQCLVLLQNTTLLKVRGHNTIAQEITTAADVHISTGSIGIVFGNGIYPVYVRIEVRIIARCRAADLFFGKRQ